MLEFFVSGKAGILRQVGIDFAGVIRKRAKELNESLGLNIRGLDDHAVEVENNRRKHPFQLFRDCSSLWIWLMRSRRPCPKSTYVLRTSFLATFGLK